MSNNRKTDSNSSRPINLDSKQLKELDTLIGSLKKEIVFPAKKSGEEPAPAKVGSGEAPVARESGETS